MLWLGERCRLDGFDRIHRSKLGFKQGSGGNPATYDREIEYQLDAAHNRVSVTEGALVEAYALKSGTNEYVSKIPNGLSSDGTYFTYDGNGNLISDGYYLYKYDYLDRLSEVYLLTYPAGVRASASSIRIRRVTDEEQRKREGKPVKLTRKEIAKILDRGTKRVESHLTRKKGAAPVLSAAVNQNLSANPGQAVEVFQAWYGYDPSNRRIYKLTVYETSFYAYDGWQLSDEFDGAIQNRKTFFASDRLDEHLGYAKWNAGTASWDRFGVIQDHLGSVVRVTDSSGATVERYEYDDYGNQRIYDASGTFIGVTQASVSNTLGYAGHQYDRESGLIYMRNRYYLPKLGRFLTHDPIGIWGDSGQLGNGSNYVAANPIYLKDKLGLLRSFAYGPMRLMTDPCDLGGGGGGGGFAPGPAVAAGVAVGAALGVAVHNTSKAAEQAQAAAEVSSMIPAEIKKEINELNVHGVSYERYLDWARGVLEKFKSEASKRKGAIKRRNDPRAKGDYCVYEIRDQWYEKGGCKNKDDKGDFSLPDPEKFPGYDVVKVGIGPCDGNGKCSRAANLVKGYNKSNWAAFPQLIGVEGIEPRYIYRVVIGDIRDRTTAKFLEVVVSWLRFDQGHSMFFHAIPGKYFGRHSFRKH